MCRCYTIRVTDMGFGMQVKAPQGVYMKNKKIGFSLKISGKTVFLGGPAHFSRYHNIFFSPESCHKGASFDTHIYSIGQILMGTPFYGMGVLPIFQARAMIFLVMKAALGRHVLTENQLNRTKISGDPLLRKGGLTHFSS